MKLQKGFQWKNVKYEKSRKRFIQHSLQCPWIQSDTKVINVFSFYELFQVAWAENMKVFFPSLSVRWNRQWICVLWFKMEDQLCEIIS